MSTRMSQHRKSNQFMDLDTEPFTLSPEYASSCHDRWIKLRGNLVPSQRQEMTEEDEEKWANEQCGQCRFYALLVGPLGSDWGACTNPNSAFDGRVKFEHDGCPQYEGAGAWVSEYFP